MRITQEQITYFTKAAPTATIQLTVASSPQLFDDGDGVNVGLAYGQVVNDSSEILTIHVNNGYKTVILYPNEAIDLGIFKYRSFVVETTNTPALFRFVYAQ